MTKPFNTIMLALLTFMFTSCAAIHEGFDKVKDVNLNAVKIGMTKAEVQRALNKKPDNVIAAKNYEETNTLVEVVQYSQWADANASNANAPANLVITQSYWLYFVNDKLNKWEIAMPDRRPRI